jgi:virulence factor Mce-like protein
MQKHAPSPGKLAVIIGFALSCFGLALFLWVSFGGPAPLMPEQYRVQVPFDEATQLADQADVRISGVSVGKVSSIDLPADGSQAMATISMEPAYAPLPVDVRAILRLKTLLGETYVELTPGTGDGPTLPEGSVLPKAQVANTVQLDEILRSLDAPTRNAFQVWMRDSSAAVAGPASESLSNSLALLSPVFDEFDKVFRTLDTQEQAVRELLSNGAVTFEALTERRGQLASLIRNSNQVFQTTAARDSDIIEIFRIFPTFLDESRLTLDRLRTFSINADPLMKQLVPVAEELSPTLIEFGNLAPELEYAFRGLRPVIDNAPIAFPAFRKFFRDDFPPLLRALDPFLRNVNPILDNIRAYKHELTALVGNATAATNGTATGESARYIRTMTLLNPNTLGTFPKRLQINRNLAYSKQGIFAQLASGLPNFDVRQCSQGLVSGLDPNSPSDSVFQARVDGDPVEAQDFFDRLKLFAFGDSLSTADVPAPGCSQQAPFAPFGAGGDKTTYPHTLEEPK